MSKFRAIILLAVLFNYGCASYQIAGVPDTLVLNEPPEISMPKPESPAPEPEELPVSGEEKLFSLSLRDADIRDVFLLLSKDSGVNIIADKDVTGTISIDFSNLDLRSALHAITEQLGYAFRAEKGFIRVSSPLLETRTFRINYITGKRTSSSTMNAAISSGGSSGATGGGSTINLNLSGSSGASQSSGSSSGGHGNVNVTTSGTSDFWSELGKGLSTIIFSNEKSEPEVNAKSGKKLIINELAGIVYVTDFPDNIKRVEQFLKDVETSVSKQVMIQAHIIEVTLNDDFRFGIDWEAIPDLSSHTLIKQGLLLSPPTEVFQIEFMDNQLKALLDTMREQGQVNVLSSPKISTMNNQKAVIKLTTKEVSWVTNSYLNADGTILQSYTSPQIDEVGLFLDVTPQVDDLGKITMQIHPSISEKTKDSLSPDGKSTKPVIDVRELDTMIKAENGQTIVIAGLITDKITETVRKVPLLGDIPFFGTIFRQTIQDKRKSELVIFLTPYILNNKSIEDIKIEHEERLKKAGRPFEEVPELKRKVNYF